MERVKARAAKPDAEDASPAAVGKLFSEAIWIARSDHGCDMFSCECRKSS